MITDEDIKGILKYWEKLFPIMACEEAGEFIQAISKMERSENNETIKRNLIDEIGDMHITLVCIAKYYGIDTMDIEERINKKLNKKY